MTLGSNELQQPQRALLPLLDDLVVEAAKVLGPSGKLRKLVLSMKADVVVGHCQVEFFEIPEAFQNIQLFDAFIQILWQKLETKKSINQSRCNKISLREQQLGKTGPYPVNDVVLGVGVFVLEDLIDFEPFGVVLDVGRVVGDQYLERVLIQVAKLLDISTLATSSGGV